MRVANQPLGSVARRFIIGMVLALLAIAPQRQLTKVLGDDAPVVETAYVSRDISELQNLVAPIALYPDALLAQVLAACTYPADVTAAATWLNAGKNSQQIDAQPWDSSVKGVARYPVILRYLANNAEWMNELGDAFLSQRGEVMNAVQNLRGNALAAGTLQNTPQQTVINDGGYIQIIPTNPDVLYPPIYDPQLVYAPPPFDGGNPYTPYITFGAAVNVGDWLDFDLDWYDHGIYYGRWGRNRPWWHERDWYRDQHDDHLRHYENLRPGNYQPGRFRDHDGHLITIPIDHWKRNEQKPVPNPVNRPVPHPMFDRPQRGYPANIPPPGNRPAPIPRGSEVDRESDRGRESRQPQGAPPQAPQVPPPQMPVRREPAPAPAPAPRPVAPAPRPSGPPPEGRQSAPVRGGAMGGYQSGATAGQSANRGAASRGK